MFVFKVLPFFKARVRCLEMSSLKDTDGQADTPVAASWFSITALVRLKVKLWTDRTALRLDILQGIQTNQSKR